MIFADTWGEAHDALRRQAETGHGENDAKGLCDQLEGLRQHTQTYAGHIKMADPRIHLRHVSLAQFPFGWRDEARGITNATSVLSNSLSDGRTKRAAPPTWRRGVNP